MFLPSTTSPLNERLILQLIEEQQAEVRRCYSSLPPVGKPFLARLGHLLRGRHRTGNLSTRAGAALGDTAPHALS